MISRIFVPRRPESRSKTVSLGGMGDEERTSPTRKAGRAAICAKFGNMLDLGTAVVNINALWALVGVTACNRLLNYHTGRNRFCASMTSSCYSA
jgi:hypothetical protein